MKKVLFFFISIIIIVDYAFAYDWSIAEIYESKAVPSNTKALDKYGNPVMSYGSMETIEKILIPCSISYGKYSVTIIKITDTFFQIKDTDYYIEMKGKMYLGPFPPYIKTADVILEKEIYGAKIVYE